MKQCRICHTFKPYDLYNKKLTNKDGYRTECKTCQAAYSATYRKENKDLIKQKKTEYRNLNKEKIAQSLKEWHKNNPKYNSNYTKYNYHNNPKFRICMLLRTRFNLALKNKSKKGSAVKLLQMPIKAFLVYLNLDCLDKYGISYTGNENLFHIDHIQPLASFDLTDPNQLKKAAHWSNLQILTIQENVKKGKTHERL
jgi:hypothetical protein